MMDVGEADQFVRFDDFEDLFLALGFLGWNIDFGHAGKHEKDAFAVFVGVEDDVVLIVMEGFALFFYFGCLLFCQIFR